MQLNAARIKQKALELGFHLAGIAPATRFPEADNYHRWLAEGYAGDMNYLKRNVEKRGDCRILFPPARSVIVCGMSYHSPITSSLQSEQSVLSGQISRYARGDDYHDIVKNALYALLEWIQRESSVPIEAKVCVDTIPILERLYGRYAGLGWIGKHGGLINPQYGSWFFLGEILINLDLEYDSPIPDRCGSCTKCLDICPTGALVAPRILDARRCISYLTIEFRGIIPEEFRPLIGNSVFGCDRCQEVCPWNKNAKFPEYSAFLPREQLVCPEFTWLCSLTPQDFSRIFKHNPIKRTKLQGVLRNTVIAIGNSKNPKYVPLLEKLSHTSVPLIQPHIAWALDKLSSTD